ncbi:MAG TPA: helix-turn-helix transcriptional regulator [Streptomyces sp.]
MERLLQLQRRFDQLTPTVVGRTKRLGASWEVISQLLGMNKDTVRKKYNSFVVQRALTRAHIKGIAPKPSPRSAAPAATLAKATEPSHPALPSAPLASAESADIDGSDPSPSTASSPPPPDPAPAPMDFACVLSNLQRVSQHSLRSLSKKTQLSPSFLSRTMNGERFPTWEATASIARACNADPEVLRKVWEDANRRRSRKSRPETLASALRYLHHRAGSPTPWSISVNSGHTLTQDQVSALLSGTARGTWDDVQVLVQTLDGECTYFEPLWQQAAPAQHTGVSSHSAGSAPLPSPAPDHGTTNRIEDLITAFGDVLSNTTRPTTRRRRRPAPIPAATTWIGR